MKEARNTIIAGVFVALIVVASAAPASALTVADIQAQIQGLLLQIASLTGQSSAQNSTAVTVSPSFQHRVCSVLYRNLSLGMRGDDVLALQEFLQAQGYFYATPTGYYGPLTAQAVARWQAANGISAVGAVGPLTRARIQALCGIVVTPPPPPPTSDPSADPRCRAWYDGCNDCSRQYPGGPAACTLRYCIWQAPAYCKEYFDGGTNKPPVISSFSGPTTLNANQTGTWTVQANDPENGPLSYHVVWGDEVSAMPMMAPGYAAEAFVQTTTFTHSYARAGTYTVIVHVRDSSGQQAQTTTTVRVEGAPQYCTMEYAPVCGQKTTCPACYYSQPACLAPCYSEYKTYSNRCMMNADGATFVYEGQCQTQPVACTADARQCPDGSWVGRTGPNCQFVCPGGYTYP